VSTIPSAKVAKQQNINVNNIQECAQRVSNLEEVVARIDKEAVNSDAKLTALSDTLFQSLASRVQNKMSILRKAFDEKVLQFDERTNKAELEVKKLQGRLGSLVEEKNQLSKKIRSLEKSNKSLSDEVEELQNNAKDDAVQRELGSAIQNEPNVNVTDRDESEVLITKEESGPIPTK
jgi:chromosome segregation ATPase